jgi:hypothetical protein
MSLWEVVLVFSLVLYLKLVVVDKERIGVWKNHFFHFKTSTCCTFKGVGGCASELSRQDEQVRP